MSGAAGTESFSTGRVTVIAVAPPRAFAAPATAAIVASANPKRRRTRVMRRSRRSVHRHGTADADAHETGDAGLLHRHAIDRIGRLGRGARVVCDDDELRAGLELVEHA